MSYIMAGIGHCHHLARTLWQKTSSSQRYLSTELSTALRPFYFAVHPDLFGQHPAERKTNEESLKVLSAHLESLYERNYSHTQSAKVLKFYIRDGTGVKRDSFKMVQIHVDKTTNDPKMFIQNLLTSCNLSTDYIKTVKSKQSTSPSPQQSSSGSSSMANSPSQDYHYDDEFATFEAKLRSERVYKKPELESWLKQNLEKSLQRSKETAELKAELVKLQKELVEKLQLRDARYECGWNIEHYRGCLKTLERLSNTHMNDLVTLRDRIVVFAPFTGISLEGHVMLFTGDVLKNWLDFIKIIPQHDAYLRVVPIYEQTLSQVLRGIQIGRRKFMPKLQAREFASHLMKVTTSLNDYLGKQNYPTSWPETLREFTIVVESEAGPLMVSPTGQFITPATCPGGLLVEFITVNMELARERMGKYETDKHIEQKLIDDCIEQLKLQSLTKDDAVTPDKMITALTELLNSKFTAFQNINLHISHYYSVLSDGVICIPWDFMHK